MVTATWSSSKGRSSGPAVHTTTRSRQPSPAATRLPAGAQAGLNWELVLKKRRGYRKAFANYNLKRVAAFDDAKLEALAQDPGIVRNRLKIASVVANARAVLRVQEEHGSFAALLWDLA